MKLSTRQIPTVLPGVRGTLRAERPTRTLLPRLRAGDIAVIDHTDLDRSTAQAIIDAGVVGVVNAKPMVSGRYPNRGPEMLAEAGITMVDGVGEAGFSCLADGRVARVHEGAVYDGEQRLTAGRALDGDTVRAEMEAARIGLAAQLEAFTLNSSELLRREEGLLLHGVGVPRLGIRIGERPIVVVVDDPDTPAQLRRMRSFLKEQRPVVVAVGAATAHLQRARIRADVLVVGPDPDALPARAALRSANDVVVATTGPSGERVEETLGRMGIEPLRFASAVAPEDAALHLVHAQDPRLVVAVGMSATLTDFLEHQRPGLASTYLARLRLGHTLVDAAAVPTLYSGRVRPAHLWLALSLCLLVVAAAVATTDVGHGWAVDLWHHLRHLRQLADAASGGSS